MLWHFPRFPTFALAFTGLAVLLGAMLSAQHSKTGGSVYALELLWWPEYCHEHRELLYCAGASFRGFVPRDFAETSPDGQIPNCACTTKSFSPDKKLLNLVPDEVLLRSLWETHGSCSGLSQRGYFDSLAKAFKSVAVPERFVWPDAHFSMSPEEIKQAFLRANRDFSPDGFFVFCRSGFLSAVQIKTARNVAAPDEICKDSSVEVIARMPLAE